jgi:hypothetical protein
LSHLSVCPAAVAQVKVDGLLFSLVSESMIAFWVEPLQALGYRLLLHD